MEPTVGNIVRYNCQVHEVSNGATIIPAIVVRNWGGGTVNLRPFWDGPPGNDIWLTSIAEAKEPGEKGCWECLPIYEAP